MDATQPFYMSKKNIFEAFECALSIITPLGKHWRFSTYFFPHTAVLLTTIGGVALKRARKMVVAAQKCG